MGLGFRACVTVIRVGVRDMIVNGRIRGYGHVTVSTVDILGGVGSEGCPTLFAVGMRIRCLLRTTCYCCVCLVYLAADSSSSKLTSRMTHSTSARSSSWLIVRNCSSQFAVLLPSSRRRVAAMFLPRSDVEKPIIRWGKNGPSHTVHK